MAERAITQKKGQFLQNLVPVNKSFDELVRDKLLCGKFPITKTGYIKIVAVIISLAALVLFLVQSECNKAADWYPYVLPVCTGASIFIELLFYLVFSCGGTTNSPGRWVAADIIFNFIFSIVAIIGSIMTTTESVECTHNASMHRIPGPVGIAGGVCTLAGCAAIFLMYRYVNQDDEIDTASAKGFSKHMTSRQSVHI